MTTLENFQEATVDAAVDALSKPKGSRRFLVADEVGLGKTIIAREVAKRLKRNGQPFNIFYLCPNLEIAAQNRDKFVSLTGLARIDGADRLSLALQDPPTIGNGYRVFSFTPETSLPSWKPGSRSGRKSERILIYSLLKSAYPNLVKELRRLDADRNKVRPLFDEVQRSVSSLFPAFELGLRTVFDSAGTPLEARILNWLETADNDLLEFLSRARSALAVAALSRQAIRPNLLIVDEFHRYADLMEIRNPEKEKTPKLQERAKVHNLVMQQLFHTKDETRPATLFLSATPYKLTRLDGSELHPSRRYQTLIDLVRFLYGDIGDDAAKRANKLVNQYHNALLERGERDQIIRTVNSAKEKLEELLRPVMARTERALSSSEDLFDSQRLGVTVNANDLQVFRHLGRSVTDSLLRPWTTPLWASVPYPAQTLHGYAIWPALLKGPRPPITIDNSRQDPAHPQYRQLSKVIISPAALQLPWVCPTCPWWRLQGPWKEAGINKSGKVLLFSQYRASPTSLSALLSMTVDKESLPSNREKEQKFSAQAYLRPRGGLNHSLLAMFTPWPVLSRVIDPARDPGTTIDSVRRRAISDLTKWVKSKNIRITKGPKRPNWMLAISLETSGDPIAARRLTKCLIAPGLEETIAAWLRPSSIDKISKVEIDALAHFLLSAPGAIVARTLARHDASLIEDQLLGETFGFCWKSLRTYLGQRYFSKTVLGRSRKKQYPRSLMRSLLDGCFEAVLDEHIALLITIQEKQQSALIQELRSGLLNTPGRVRVRRRGKDRSIRVHAAVPFAGGERRGGRNQSGEKLRSDTIRRAFNSPFWPHVLSTTSIGQEGLDFHLWCDQIVHWDLPRDPVEFEQREGRICRYASLVVRRALASEYASAAYLAGSNESPFMRLFQAARSAKSDGIGLEKWWTPRKFKPRRFTFDWKFSLRQSRMANLENDLLYYRLGIGQPEPEKFMQLLHHIKANRETARSLALDLSPLAQSKNFMTRT